MSDLPLSEKKVEYTGEPRVASINVSLEKGTIKKPVSTAIFDECGIEGDAHSGPWHRQVSLLSAELIHDFAAGADREINYGEFAENITVAGLDLSAACPLDRLKIGAEVELEVTQIGKKCHGDNCAIYREVGSCVMPHQGLFARVICGGTIHSNDAIEYSPFTLGCEIVTLSDRAVAGVYEDRSGPRIESLLNEFFAPTRWRTECTRTMIPDDEADLRDCVRAGVTRKAPILITTGGTGLGPRDITVDVVRPMLDREIPGIMEYVRCKYGAEKPGALLSRSIAGVIGETLVFCLPGGQKAVAEYMHEINRVLEHLLFAVRGIDRHS